MLVFWGALAFTWNLPIMVTTQEIGKPPLFKQPEMEVCVMPIPLAASRNYISVLYAFLTTHVNNNTSPKSFLKRWDMIGGSNVWIRLKEWVKVSATRQPNCKPITIARTCAHWQAGNMIELTYRHHRRSAISRALIRHNVTDPLPIRPQTVMVFENRADFTFFARRYLRSMPNCFTQPLTLRCQCTRKIYHKRYINVCKNAWISAFSGNAPNPIGRFLREAASGWGHLLEPTDVHCEKQLALSG